MKLTLLHIAERKSDPEDGLVSGAEKSYQLCVRYSMIYKRMSLVKSV